MSVMYYIQCQSQKSVLDTLLTFVIFVVQPNPHVEYSGLPI